MTFLTVCYTGLNVGNGHLTIFRNLQKQSAEVILSKQKVIYSIKINNITPNSVSASNVLSVTSHMKNSSHKTR